MTENCLTPVTTYSLVYHICLCKFIVFSQGTEVHFTLQDRPLNDSVNNNGTFDGHQYFQCLPRHGLFVNLSALRPDLRFSESRSEEASTVTNRKS